MGERMDIATYVTNKPVRVYVLNGYEVEHSFLWDTLSAIHAEKENLNEAGNGYGARDVDPELGAILIEMGLVKYGIRYWLVPLPAFDAFYEAVEAAWSTVWKTPDDIPEYIWKLPPPPAAGDASAG